MLLWLAPIIVLAHDAGPAYVAQNDGRYGAVGTPYDAGDVGQQDNLVLLQRTSLGLTVGRHTVILLYAPFELRTRFVTDDDFRFRGTTFDAGAVLDHRYQFEGYRGSYLYRFVDGAIDVDGGASVQVRNAAVVFSTADGRVHDGEYDVGAVFAVKARLRWTPRDSVWTQLEADALSTFGLLGDTRGGIYDVGLSVGAPVAGGLDVLATARLIGGGAEVPSQDIDNWGNYVALTVGIRITRGRAGAP
jgi:hypothetical protein